MLRRVKKLFGYKLRSEDGDIGKVDDFYFDDQSWIVRYVVVDIGSWLTGRRVLISPHALGLPDGERGVFPTQLTKDQIGDSPDIDLNKPVSRQQFVDLHEYYGWPAYWGGSPMLGAASVGAYPAVLGGAEALEEEIHEEGVVEEKYSGDPHLRSCREVIGYGLHATDGDIGSADDMFVNEETWRVHYLLVDTGSWLSGHKVIIPLAAVQKIRWPEQEIYVSMSRDKIRNSPKYEPVPGITREYEAMLHHYYGFPEYWFQR